MIRIIEFYQGTPDAVMERLCSTISKAFEMIPFHVRSAAGRFVCISKALHIVEAVGNLFCFSVREADCGAIYYYNHEFEYGENPEEYVTFLAESITTFINSLVENKDDEE